MACGVAAFAIPPRLPVRAVLSPSRWLRHSARPAAVCIVAIIATALLLFASRTWLYTGVFSVFYGTQRDLLATWQPGMRWRDGVARMIGSLMMVLTVNDPARFDVSALPVLAGACAAIASVVGIPRLRALPLATVLFFFASIAGALFARGSAYPGRFSVHVIPVTCALSACAAAALTQTGRRLPS